jgi:hypothetical protein
MPAAVAEVAIEGGAVEIYHFSSAVGLVSEVDVALVRMDWF